MAGKVRVFYFEIGCAVGIWLCYKEVTKEKQQKAMCVWV